MPAMPERYGEPEQVGAEFSPAAARAVGQYADDGIDERVPQPRDEKHRAYGGGRKTEDVGVEKEQVGAE